MAEDPVPAVTEAEATGDIAAIFADIRAVYRVGVVNLIWRHLATIPDALPWAWQAIRPLFVDTTIQYQAAVLRGGLSLPVLPPIPPEVLSALGLSPGDLARIRAVLEAYHRTNSMALVALTALAHPGNPRRPASTVPVECDEGPDEIPLPPLPSLDALPPDVGALVNRLNSFGTVAEKPILASMYRHLAHWPPYLGLVWAVLAPLHQSGTLHAAIAVTAARAKALSATILMPNKPPPPGAREAIAPFIDDVLPKMVAICGMLHAMTTAPDA